MVVVFSGFWQGEIALFQTLRIWNRLRDTVGGYGSAVTAAAYSGQE